MGKWRKDRRDRADKVDRFGHGLEQFGNQLSTRRDSRTKAVYVRWCMSGRPVGHKQMQPLFPMYSRDSLSIMLS